VRAVNLGFTRIEPLSTVRPADVAKKTATRLHSAINLKTVKTLGIAIPPSLRLRADEIIE